MAPVSKEPNEAEILLNRVNVALARSQRLIASWLPQNPVDEDSFTNTQQTTVEADDELFQPDSELLGVGAVPADKSSDHNVRKETTSLDILRKRILGKRAGKTMSKIPKPFGQASLAQRKMIKTNVQSHQQMDISREDEEESRATAVVTTNGAIPENSKGISSTPNDCIENLNVQSKAQLDGSANAVPAIVASTKRKSTNFLDEILAEKANKKKRKKMKKMKKMK